MVSFLPKWLSRGKMGLPGAMDPWDGTTYDPTQDMEGGGGEGKEEMSVEEWRKELNKKHTEQMSWSQRFFWNEDFEHDIASDEQLEPDMKQQLLDKCTMEYDNLTRCVQLEGYNSCRIKRRKYFVCLIDKREQYLDAKGQLSWFRKWTIERERRRGDTGLSELSETESTLFDAQRNDDFIDPSLVDIDQIMKEEFGTYSNKKQ